MTTAEATVGALLAHGLDTIYALPGVHNDEFFDALAKINTEAKAAAKIRTVHTRHEQGAAYMALGAALATGKPQVYCVVPGPGLLNSAAALLTAYGMNAPVLALFGQIPQDAIGRGLGYLHEVRDQAGIIARLVDWSARIRSPDEAPLLVAEAIRSMFVGRPGPAALECAIDVWGRSGPVVAQAPLPAVEPPIDEDAVEAAAKRLGAAERPLIVAGGGAQDASGEVTQLAHLLQAPVLSYRRGRGVLDDRDPLAVTLPLGHELWAEADVVLAVGTHLHYPLQQWGFDRDLGDRSRRCRRRGAGPGRQTRGRADRPRQADFAPPHRPPAGAQCAAPIANSRVAGAPRPPAQAAGETRAAARLSGRDPGRVAGGRNFCR